MTDVHRRRQAWHALGLGPLWLPVAGRLPGAPLPTHIMQDCALQASPASPTPAERQPVAGQGVAAPAFPPTGPDTRQNPLQDTFQDTHPAERPAPPPAQLTAPPAARAPQEAAPHAAHPAACSTAHSIVRPAGGLAASLGAALGVPLPAGQPAATHEVTRPPASSSTPARGNAAATVLPPAAPEVSGAPAHRRHDPPASGASAPPDDDLPIPGGEWLEPWTVEDGWVEEPGVAAFDEPPGFWDEPGLAAGAPFTAAQDAPAPSPLAPAPSIPQRWQALREAVAGCQRCPLAQTRQNVVFGRGRPEQARWLLIGEAPGAEEDRQGEAFVGQAGRLLDAMLQASGIDPEAEVFIANVLKCRPPGNRNPEAGEVARCEGFLHEQIRLTQPDGILLLGRFAAQSVLQSELPIGRLRNKVHHITLDGRRIPVVVTYHPAYLLRNPLDKLKSWEDLCLARTAIDKADKPPQPLPGGRATR